MSAFWSAVKAGAKTKTGQKIISALTGGKQKTTGTEVITNVKSTSGLEQTEAYKKSVKKTLNKAKLDRSQERIDAWWKKNKKKFK